MTVTRFIRPGMSVDSQAARSTPIAVPLLLTPLEKWDESGGLI